MKFLKKAASALWEFEEPPEAAPRRPARPAGADNSAPAAPRIAAPTRPAAQPADMTVEAVYQAASVPPGPAPKLAKFLESMASAPRDAVRAAVTAFAAADGSWSDVDVLRDVEARLQALAGYEALVAAHADDERAEVDVAVDEAVGAIQSNHDAVAAQVAELTARLDALQVQLVEAGGIRMAKQKEIAERALRAAGRSSTERAAMEAVKKFFTLKG